MSTVSPARLFSMLSVLVLALPMLLGVNECEPNRDPSFYGVNQCCGQGTAAAFAGGFRWIRVGITWNQPTESSPPDWNATIAYVSALKDQGYSILGLVGPLPAWALGTPDGNCPAGSLGSPPPRDYSTFYNLMHSAASALHPYIAAWEISNEPDLCDYFLGSKAQYRDLVLAPGYDAIKAVGSDLLVLAPSLHSGAVHNNGAAAFKGWLEQNGQGPLVRQIDRVSFHAYGSVDLVKDNMASANAYVDAKTSGAPYGYTLTEFGFAEAGASGGLCEKPGITGNPASKTTQVFDYCRGLGGGLWCDKAYYFLLSEGTSPGVPSTCTFWLFDQNGSPMPKFAGISTYLLANP